MAILGIDACNIQGGGGITHLRELLAAADPSESGFTSVVVWGGGALELLPSRSWLKVIQLSNGTLSVLDQFRWNLRGIHDSYAKEKCDLIFSPGGTFVSKQVPYVSMSQNMLLHEVRERRRFPLGKTRLRYSMLRAIQAMSFLHARGIVFISNYAKRVIESQWTFTKSKPSKVIYHGVNDRFSTQEQRQLLRKANTTPTILYVSRVNFYKHQWNVVDAVDQLNHEGKRCHLRLVGGGHKKALKKLSPYLSKSQNAVCLGDVSYESIDEEYRNADLFLFASTCENMPNILVEAMAAGLPIASSDYGPMPEVLGEGVYFDPTDVESIKRAITFLLDNPRQCREMSEKNREKAARFRWETAANETFQFLRDCIPQ